MTADMVTSPAPECRASANRAASSVFVEYTRRRRRLRGSLRNEPHVRGAVPRARGKLDRYATPRRIAPPIQRASDAHERDRIDQLDGTKVKPNGERGREEQID